MMLQERCDRLREFHTDAGRPSRMRLTPAYIARLADILDLPLSLPRPDGRPATVPVVIDWLRVWAASAGLRFVDLERGEYSLEELPCSVGQSVRAVSMPLSDQLEHLLLTESWDVTHETIRRAADLLGVSNKVVARMLRRPRFRELFESHNSDIDNVGV